tara:strand:- start:8191 stop:8643 length:453 start_codon:yes stop_codon:yes gene_type:complete
MNTKDFVKVLRAVIREEVRSAVRQEVKDILIESLQQAAKPVIDSRPVRQAKPMKNNTPAPKRYSGNSIIDQVLNETKLTSDFRQSPDVSEWPEMNYTTQDLTSHAAPTSIMNMDVEDDFDSLPATAAPSFMKDYSQLMKKADLISQQKQI